MAFRRCGVLVVAAVVGLAVGVPPAVGADASSKNGRIAFTRDFLDVWSMRPDGSSPVNLTADSAAADWMPSWRPDGRKLAFMSNRVTPTNPGPDPDYEIFVMNADGSGVRQLTANALDDETPSWSPDGHKLVFQRDFNPIAEQVDYDLFTMHADGTHQRNLTSSPGVNEQEADWSPNDRRIAFASDRDGDFELYTMRPDGSRVRQLTNNQGPDDRNPAWSPDGRRIAFDSNRDGPEGEIYTMRAHGSGQTRLTFDQAGSYLPAWSPDGRLIAFTSFRDGNGEIYTMHADGSHQVNRTQNPAYDRDPDWQPLPKHLHRASDPATAAAHHR
jgi:Tol biopolymer transport system component